jgi:hypothetical protein
MRHVKIFWSLFLLATVIMGRNVLSEGPTTRIAFCHFNVADSMKRANASFSIVYTFQVSENGQPQAIKKVKDEFVGLAAVENCLRQWRLAEADPHADIAFSAYWKHGQGWIELTLVGGGLSTKIVRVGDLVPYANSAATDRSTTRDAADVSSMEKMDGGP